MAQPAPGAWYCAGESVGDPQRIPLRLPVRLSCRTAHCIKSRLGSLSDRAPPHVATPAAGGPGAFPMPRSNDAPRDLLFGLLALQNGMVTRDQLVAAFGAWTGAHGRPLAELLSDQGALRPEHRPLLDALVDAHLRLHDGDPEKSLAVLDLNRSTRESLARAGGPVVEATLAHVGSGSNSDGDGDVDHTMTYVVGAATSDGQRFRVLRP